MTREGLENGANKHFEKIQNELKRLRTTKRMIKTPNLVAIAQVDSPKYLISQDDSQLSISDNGK